MLMPILQGYGVMQIIKTQYVCNLKQVPSLYLLDAPCYGLVDYKEKCSVCYGGRIHHSLAVHVRNFYQCII